jgi:hypothetical protein
VLYGSYWCYETGFTEESSYGSMHTCMCVVDLLQNVRRYT